jgi:hypothetical protein
MGMYFCIQCKEVHDKEGSGDKVFSSGYVLINESKVSLGICQSQDKEEKVQKIS